MKRTILLLCALWGSLTFALAQVNPQEGYLITLDNDTIHGLIDYRTAAQNARECHFYPSEGGTPTIYTPQDILAYRFLNDGKYYVSRSVHLEEGPSKLFLEYLIEGIVNLYYLPQRLEDLYFLEDEHGEMHLCRITPQVAESTDDNVQERRAALTPAFTAFRRSTRTTNRLWESAITKKNMTRLTKAYHHEICTDEQECIQFEYDARKEQAVKIRWNLGVGASITTLSVPVVLEQPEKLKFSGAGPQIRVAADACFPRFSKGFIVQPAIALSYLMTSATHRALDYSAKLCLYDLQLGAGYRFTTADGAFSPILRAGFVISSVIHADSEYPSAAMVYLDKQAEFHTGYYLGISLQHELQRGALQLSLTYQKRNDSEISRLSSLDLGIAYCF
ncbi:MAG: hypothetical protein IJ511_04980 [Bacteroides sp.]|nr:hypothetical protein [Bacteroides sp.]